MPTDCYYSLTGPLKESRRLEELLCVDGSEVRRGEGDIGGISMTGRDYGPPCPAPHCTQLEQLPEIFSDSPPKSWKKKGRFELVCARKPSFKPLLGALL